MVGTVAVKIASRSRPPPGPRCCHEAVSTAVSLPKRILLGRPLSSASLGDTLLPKRLALPVFCSDPLSSNAYATEEILLVLSVGGLALLHLTPWVAGAVALLLTIVVLSYRQTCYAYPEGGGAYGVSKANLGQKAALVAAAALMIDYVMTVAVSVAAGVSNIVSAAPSLAPHAVPLCLGLIALLAIANLRGVKESGTFFAIPTYGFVLVVYTTIAVGITKVVLGHTPVAESASYVPHAPASSVTGLALVAIVLRAFASGCTALTGVEAISNGVPSFRAPKSRNAASTLAVMAVLTIALFAGITVLAVVTKVHIAENVAHLTGAPHGYVQRTVIAQVAGAVWGDGTLGFYLVQAFTALILILAANTAFNGFPALASILAADGFLPRQLARRGDRLVYSNGILILASVAGLLIVAYHASPNRLMQLYILGVFVSFTLSQAGMVKHWTTHLRTAAPSQRGHMLRSRVVNGIGAVTTFVVLIIVLLTKFVHGAFLVVIAIPVLFMLMESVRKHYDRVDQQTRPRPEGVPLPSRVHALVLVSRLNAPVLQAVAYARASRPATLTALSVRTQPEETDALLRAWDERRVPIPLTVLDSPYRDITRPATEYIQSIRRSSPRDVVAVYIPEYVVRHWWEHMLHNQSALRLKARLIFLPGVMVISVPWLITNEQPAGAILVS